MTSNTCTTTITQVGEPSTNECVGVHPAIQAARISGSTWSRFKRRVLILGAGQLATDLCRALLSKRTGMYEVIGFLDQDPMRVGERHGILSSVEHTTSYLRLLSCTALKSKRPVLRSAGGNCMYNRRYESDGHGSRGRASPWRRWNWSMPRSSCMQQLQK